MECRLCRNELTEEEYNKEETMLRICFNCLERWNRILRRERERKCEICRRKIEEKEVEEFVKHGYCKQCLHKLLTLKNPFDR